MTFTFLMYLFSGVDVPKKLHEPLWNNTVQYIMPFLHLMYSSYSIMWERPCTSLWRMCPESAQAPALKWSTLHPPHLINHFLWSALAWPWSLPPLWSKHPHCCQSMSRWITSPPLDHIIFYIKKIPISKKTTAHRNGALFRRHPKICR